MQQSISNTQFYKSVSLILCSAVFLSMAAAFGKHMLTFGSLQMIVFIRFFVPLVIVFFLNCIVFRNKIKVKSIYPHLIRAMFVVASQFCLFYVLLHGNVLSATLLYSTSGLFAPFVTILILRTSVKKKTIFASVLGLVGVFIAIGSPHFSSSKVVIIGLLSGLFTACSYMAQHYSSKSDSAQTINIMSYGLCSVATLAIILFSNHLAQFAGVVRSASPNMLLVILLFSMFSILNQTCKSYGYKLINKAASMGPFLYSGIIFSGVIDWLWLGIRPDALTYVGVAVIISSAIVMSVRRA